MFRRKQSDSETADEFRQQTKTGKNFEDYWEKNQQ